LNKFRAIVFLLIVINLIGCNTGNENQDYSNAERFIMEKGYTIIKDEGYVHEYTLEKELLTEMPYIQNWSVQSVDPTTYVARE
jgi:hypothetical protein